ncbi:hypothetical protein [Winogradskyella pacifica]|uniref:hypothetical protein n=1 Tax=Winogradskyella pacifica TaxID=664642 RepID=UPI0015C854EA|nr:hypothetical protein [Winogradskyella pacifica]
MNNSTEILFTIGQIISSLSTLILLIAALILFIKKKTLATWLILIGNILVFITYIGSLLLTVFTGSASMDTILMAQGFSIIVQNLSYSLFAIGLIILALTEFSKPKS